MRQSRTNLTIIVALTAVTDFTTLVAADGSAHIARKGHKKINVQLGPRPYFVVNDMDAGDLKDRLLACSEDAVETTDFSIGHRGAALQFPEHTRESGPEAKKLGEALLAERRKLFRNPSIDGWPWVGLVFRANGEARP